jgi:hypothetical protein
LDQVKWHKQEALLIPQYQRGYKTTVELSDYKFWGLYDVLEDLDAEFIEAYHASIDKVIPWKLTIRGAEYSHNEISEALSELRHYMETSGITPEEWEKQRAEIRQTFASIDADPWASMMASIERVSKTHSPTMEFKVWEYVLPLIGAFNEPEEMMEGDPNEWSPPDNFQGGTDDEREVWNDHHGRKE